jgi:hypothetical protein
VFAAIKQEMPETELLIIQYLFFSLSDCFCL